MGKRVMVMDMQRNRTTEGGLSDKEAQEHACSSESLTFLLIY